MTDKFSTHHLTIVKLVALVPSVIDQYDWKDIKDAVCFYKSGNLSKDCALATLVEVRNEFEQWKDFCLRMPANNRPQTPLEALDIIPTRYVNIKRLLTIFTTLPVTTCTVERAFSTLKILKNYLRNSMTDERLTGLALMYIHPEIEIDIETVIDRFAAAQPLKSKKRACKVNTAVPPKSKRRRLHL